jgi:hypothetical protein
MMIPVDDLEEGAFKDPAAEKQAEEQEERRE